MARNLTGLRQELEIIHYAPLIQFVKELKPNSSMISLIDNLILKTVEFIAKVDQLIN